MEKKNLILSSSISSQPFSFLFSRVSFSCLVFFLSVLSPPLLPRFRAANFPLRPRGARKPARRKVPFPTWYSSSVTGYWPGYLSIIKTIHTYRLSRSASIVFSALSINVLIDFGPSLGERDPSSRSACLARFCLSCPFSHSHFLWAILKLVVHNRHSVEDGLRKRANLIRKKVIEPSLILFFFFFFTQ